MASSSSILDCVSTPALRADVRDVFETITRVRSDNASSSARGTSGAVSATTSVQLSQRGILDLIRSVTDATVFSTSASTTATSTHRLGSTIADAITGGNSGNGTSDIGPFVKCVLLSGIGWPIPTFATECPTGTSTPATKGTLTLVKNTIGGNGDFGFTLGGAGNATTTLSTSGGSASVNFILNPGAFTISENTLASSTWSLTGRGCTVHAASIGSTFGQRGWSFSITAGQHVTCIFTNTATSTATTTPGGGGTDTTTGAIVVIKLVSGGTASSSDFLIHVKHATSSSATTSLDITGSPKNGTTTGSIYMNVGTGTYMVSESNEPSGYTATFSGACDSSGALTVTAGATSTCTITNTWPATNTGGGGGGCTENCGGGGGSGGGGGGNGPIVGSFGSGGGNPALGGGGYWPGEVLGTSATVPEGVGGYVPEVPNTGAGGNFIVTFATLLLSLVCMTAGIWSLSRTTR